MFEDQLAHHQRIYVTFKPRSSTLLLLWFGGCFSSQGRGGLYFLSKGQTMNATRYIDVLDSHLLQFMTIHGYMTFQQDSAPCHKAKAVTKWLQAKNVKVLQWPGNFLDLKPCKKFVDLG